MRISILASRELQAIVAVARYLDRDVRTNIRKQTRTFAREAWQAELRQTAETRLEHRVLADTARVKVSDRNVMLTSASVGRKLKGGLLPASHWHAVEFGADDEQVTYTARTPKGGTRKVTRNTRAQLRNRKRTGHVVYPAAAAFIPRAASLWVQTAVRTIHEAFEGGSHA